MRTSITFKSITLTALLGVALTTTVLAQPGPGMGGGMGMGMGMGGGPCMQNSGPGVGQMGPAGRGMRGMRFDQSNTRGWALMTQEERTAMQIKMRAVKTYDECKVVQGDRRKVMETRAKEKGVTLPAPRQNACDNMKTRGLIK